MLSDKIFQVIKYINDSRGNNYEHLNYHLTYQRQRNSEHIYQVTAATHAVTNHGAAKQTNSHESEAKRCNSLFR